jgi:hypothetical protein
MAKRLNNNEVIGLITDTSASAWVNEINTGAENPFAIAVKKGITFFNGKEDTTGVTWDGVQELEVIIPTLADIVSNPVTLKGVINSAADVPSSASNGDLYYIGTSGSYFDPAVACEAGDMAVYYNNTWHVIQGENQVSLASNALTLTSTPQTAITVEGQDLTLAIDYNDVRNNVSLSKNAAVSFSVVDGNVTVPATYVNLSQADGSTVTISTSTKTIDLPTALASGKVTINENVLEASNLHFTAGSYPEANKNADAITINASTDIAVSGEYLTSVTAVGSVSFASAAAADTDKIAFVAGLSAASGTEFVTGVKVYDSTEDAGKAIAFTVPGEVTVSGLSTFVSGLGTAAAAGDNNLVSDVIVGAVTVDNNGTSFLSGLSAGGNSVVTSVTFGSAIQDTSASWFYSGLGEGNDVVTDITAGSVSLVSGNNTAGLTSSAVVSASVSNHVLSFTTDTFMKPVDVSYTAPSPTKAGFTLSGVKLSGFDSGSDTFLKAGISQANSTVSYKSVLTGEINLSQAAGVSYVWNVAEDHAYTADMGYAKLSVTDATVSKSTPTLTNKTITATIPSNTVVVSLTSGTAPSFSVDNATGALTASVGTSLTSSQESWIAFASAPDAIKIPGAYTLTSDSGTGAIEVGKAGECGVADAIVTISASTFVTDVQVDGTSVVA